MSDPRSRRFYAEKLKGGECFHPLPRPLLGGKAKFSALLQVLQTLALGLGLMSPPLRVGQ
ncbi:MAG: hypothetical protein SW833_02370 [Cyanobacteriota bacterium]|nr:hypothetical protein [Cyanobacteriota bacterium]